MSSRTGDDDRADDPEMLARLVAEREPPLAELEKERDRPVIPKPGRHRPG